MHHRHKFLALLALALFFAVEASAGESEKGRELYLLKCVKCHKLRDPADYSDEKWSYWMKKMKKKAHLSDEQYDLISQYVESVRKVNGKES